MRAADPDPGRPPDSQRADPGRQDGAPPDPKGGDRGETGAEDRPDVEDEEQAGEVATLAGGCFWCTEAVLERLRGVGDVIAGYTGGHAPDPSYHEVCTGTTGHAEAVQVPFDPDELSYEELLEVFFATHDPTSRDRQGPDIGSQYRSAIFYDSPEQKETAERVIRRLEDEEVFDSPIVTEVEPLGTFYRAEPEHQDFYRRHSGQPYCVMVINPKMAEMRKRFAQRLKE